MSQQSKNLRNMPKSMDSRYVVMITLLDLLMLWENEWKKRKSLKVQRIVTK